jgi:PAS domain-containing protein
LLGYSLDELLTLTVLEIAPPPNRDSVPEILATFLTLGTLSGEHALVCKNGLIREVEFRAVANVLPGLHLAVHRDITEQKKVQAELKKSQERSSMQLAELSQIFSRSPDVTQDALAENREKGGE